MLRIDFYNEIARIITYDTANDLAIEPNDDEKAAIERLLDILGRSYYNPHQCIKTVSTYYQDKLREMVDPKFEMAMHDDCPCVRSEKHDSFHRCKHGFFSK